MNKTINDQFNSVIALVENGSTVRDAFCILNIRSTAFYNELTKSQKIELRDAVKLRTVSNCLPYADLSGLKYTNVVDLIFEKIKIIESVICKSLEINPSLLHINRKFKEHVTPRHYVMYMCHKNDIKPRYIAEHYSMTYATIYHGINVIENQITYDKQTILDIGKINILMKRKGFAY